MPAPPPDPSIALRCKIRPPDPYAYMRPSPMGRASIDAVVLLLLAVPVAAMVLRPWGVSTPWEPDALLRAFFRWEGGAIKPGPLGIGLINTLRLSFWALIPAGCVGLALGFLRSSPFPARRFIGGRLVELFRNLPPLVLVFIIHYFLTGALAARVDWSGTADIPFLSYLLPEPARMPAFVSAVVTLGLYEGAYVGEIVRAGISCVPAGQWEAAGSLGFSRFAALRLIILPQAVRFMVPPLTGQAASLIKDSAIMSVISVRELTFQSMEYSASTGLAGEVWISVTLCYLLLCLAVSFVGGRLERRLNRY